MMKKKLGKIIDIVIKNCAIDAKWNTVIILVIICCTIFWGFFLWLLQLFSNCPVHYLFEYSSMVAHWSNVSQYVSHVDCIEHNYAKLVTCIKESDFLNFFF